MSKDEALKWDCGKCEGTRKQRVRNCAWLEIPEENLNQNIAWGFAPSLRNCPWSLFGVSDNDEDHTWRYITWWREWRDLSILPYGGTNLGQQPNFVVQVITACEDEALKYQEETQSSGT